MPEDKPSALTTVSKALASSAGVLVMVPLMVAVLGASLTLFWANAMRASTKSAAAAKLEAEVAVLAVSVDIALAQADPMGARLHELAASWQSGDDPAEHACDLADLIAAHPGV